MLKNKIYIIILLFIFLPLGSIFAQTKLDSLKEELSTYIEENGNDTVTLSIVKKLYNETIEIDPLTASQYAAQGQQIAVELGDTIEYAIMLGYIGNTYLEQKIYNMALKSHFTAFEIFSKFNDKKNTAYALINIGRTYVAQDIHYIAEEKFKNAIEIFKEIYNPTGEAIALKNLGIVNLSLDEELALEYFSQAIEILSESENISVISDIEILESQAYMQLYDIEKAIEKLDNAFNYYKNTKDKIKIAQIYFQYGTIYSDDDKMKKAKFYFEKSLFLYENLKANKKIAKTNTKLANIYFQLENYPRAIVFANKSLNIAENFGFLSLQKEAYYTLANSYNKLNDYKTAFQQLDKYAEILNSIYEEKKQQQFSDFQMNLETQSKEKEINIIKIESAKEKLQIAQEQYKRNKTFIFIIAILVLGFIIFLFFRFREKSKSHKLLMESNIQLKTEIEDRKLAEIKMKNSEEQYKLLFRKTPIGIMQYNEELQITDVNERFMQIFNVKRASIINTDLNTIFDRNSVYTFDKALNSKKDNFKKQTEIVTKGKVIYISMTIKPYSFNFKNEIKKGGVVIVEDLTERKKTEKLYTNGIHKKQNLLNLFPDNLILINKNFEVIELHIPNSPDIEISSNHLSEIVPKDAFGLFEKNLKEVQESKKTSNFLFIDNITNIKYKTRIIPDNKEDMLVIITQFQAFADDNKIIENNNINENNYQTNNNTSKKDNYYRNLQKDIEKELMPLYQNIQKKLSFIMLKGFAEKILTIGEKYNNKKIKIYGNDLLEYITIFNVIKVNEIIAKFPSLISEYIGYNTISL